jgi:hypothetical protein
MNKDEVLAKSRQDNQSGDEREKHLRLRAFIPMWITMVSVGGILMFLERFFLDTDIVSYSVQFMFFSCLCVQNWYELAVTRKKHLIIFGCIWTLLVIAKAWDLAQAFIAMR